MGRRRGVNALLDTHTMIWTAISPQMLGREAASVIADERNTIFISAASAWEISTKVRLGKLPIAELLEGNFMEAARIAGYSLLSIDVETALRAGRLPGKHRDPFDRMIAAQALAMDIPVISSDARLEEFGVRRIW